MKNLNLFRKSARGSEGSTLASAVVRPSFDRRSTVVKHLAFMLLFLLGSLNVWGETAIITFANQTSGTSDGSAAYTTSNFVSTGIASSDAAFGTITCSVTNKCYSGKVNMGLKAGASSNAGSFTISFSTPITNVTQITLNRAAYSSTKSATITVKNGTTTLADAVSTGTNASLNNMDITGLNIASLSGLTVETSKYCYIKSITITYTPSGGSDPTVTLTPTSKSVAATDVENQSVTITPANFSGSITSVTSELYNDEECTSATAPEDAWVKNITVNGAKTAVIFDVDDNNGAARNIWMKITASDGTGNASAVLSITQAKYEAPATLPFAYDGNGTGELPNGLSVSGTGTYNSSPKIKFDTSGDNIIIHFSDAPGKLKYDIKGNTFSGGTFTVQESEDGTDYTEVASYTSLSDVQNEEYDLNSASRYVKFIYTNKSNGNVALGNIVISKYVAPAAVATPTISGETPFLTSTTVTITQAEADAIYYTTDGSDPKTSGTKQTYSAPFTVNAEGTTTVKAYAVKGSDESDVASKEFTKVTPLTIANVLSGIEETEGDAFLLNDVTVTYVSGTNIYVKDASGYILVYDKNSAITGAENGKVLHGLWGKAKLYNGLPEISTVTQAPTVTDGSAVVPEELNAYPTDADLNKYVTLEGVTFASAATLSGSVTNIDGTFKETTLILRNQFKLNGISVATGKSYRVVGVVQKYNETYQVYPITITEIVEAGAPEAPTFSVAAGTYTSVQSVELSCATEGATIYYTTDGATPTTESTVYSSAIEVGADMTIKAIAIKDEKESSIASATYVINLPENEEVRKTWDLSIASYSANSENKVTWSATYVSMVADKHNSSNPANNYLGGDANNRTSSRFYKDSKLTITPDGKTITSIVFTATSDSYAGVLANSTWTNATAVASGTTVTVTAMDGDAAVSAVIGGTCGFTAVQVNYITDTRVAAGLTWSTDAVEITLGELFSAPTLTNPNSIAEGEITIESNNTALAIVAGGVVSLVENATGTATITASFAGNALYKATEVSYTIKVNKPLSPWASVYSSNVEIESDVDVQVTINEANNDAVKVNKGSSATITLPQGVTTIHLHLVAWNGEAQTVSVSGDCFNEAKELAIEANAGVSGQGTTYNLGASGVDYYFSLTPDNEVAANTVITIAAEGQKRFVLFGVNQEGGIVPVLDRIEISGDLTNKSGYKAGDALDLDGLTVSATYTLGGTPQTPVDITDDAELAWSYDPLVENQTSVTITASYKGQTDDITINDLEPVASADPVIYVQPSLNVNFGTVAPNASVENKTITVTLTNVANATATLGGTNPEAFSITPASPAALTESGDITISVVSTANVGTYSATITISDDAEAATSKVVNLSLVVEDVETAVSTTSEWVAATEADLVDGAEVLITGAKDGVVYAMGADRGNNRFAVAGILNEGVFTPGENTMSFTLVAQSDGKFALRTSNGKYLYAGGTGNSNYLNTKAYAGELDANAKWNITISSIIATSTNRNDMRFNYNNNNPALISCYQSTSTNPAITLYVPKPAPEPVYEEVRSELTVGRHYTVCLPKNITHIKGATFWNLQYKNEGNTEVYLVEETAPEAGKPYIIQATADKLEVIYGEEIAANPVENGALRGTFTGINETDFAALEGTVYLLINNAIRPRKSGNYLDANRAYVRYDLLTVVTSMSMPGRRVKTMPMAPQVATGLENGELMNDAMVKKVLINGQLFILRGEKMYDAKGQLVK